MPPRRYVGYNDTTTPQHDIIKNTGERAPPYRGFVLEELFIATTTTTAYCSSADEG